jgi:alkylated DNA repair dioxygenase AlkB
MTQRSLFGGPEPVRPDVHLQREYLTRDGAHILLATLTETLPWEQRSLTRYEQTVQMPRLECWLSTVPGAVYTYSGVRYEALDLWAPDMAIMYNLLTAINKDTQQQFNAVFANLYRTGQDSIGWHADDEPVLGPTRDVVIASLSLGARRRFVMKRRATDARAEWSLGEGDLLIMGPGCQSEWLHQVPKTTKPVGPRLNLTFRRVRG